MGVQSIRALQRTHGNQATLRLIGRATAATGDAPQPIQRLLMTSTQFIKGVGYKPHRNIKLPGKTFKEQSTHYKKVLDALDEYHYLIRRTAITDHHAVEVFDEKLNNVVTYCKEYLSREESPDTKMKDWLNRLINDASFEKREVRKIAKEITTKIADGSLPTNSVETWVSVMGGGESGGLTLPRGAQVEKSADPGVEASFKKNTEIFTDPTLKSPAGMVSKGDLCVRHETSNLKVVFVETYTLDKSKDNPKPTFGPQGYVDARTVGSSTFKHKAKDADRPIFPRPPCMEDVNQQAIGDCFLLAALGGIVKNNPEFIYRMIRDNRDGTVTVRLYDTTKNIPEARYLQITKSLISHGRRSKGALWVPLIEKAYAALGVHYQNDMATKVSSSYLQLGEGGHSHHAFMILTGTLGATSSKPMSEDPALFPASKPWGKAETIKYDHHQDVLRGVRVAPQRASYLEQMNSYQILDRDAALTAKWVEFLNKEGVINRLDTAASVETFASTFNEHRLDPAVKVKMMAEVRKYFRSKRGLGQYTLAQLRCYHSIETALAGHKHVALGTPEKIAKVEEERGHSAGESVAKGLVGSHVYTVLAVRHDAASGRRWVRIRNPWGKYGRAYKEKGEGVLSAKKATSAEFELELSDLTKRFDNVYYSG